MLHHCDKIMDGKMALYRECFFGIVRNNGEESYFHRF